MNRIVRELVAQGHVRVVRDDVRPYAYALTARGSQRQNELRYAHYGSVAGSAREAGRRIESRLRELGRRGV